MSWGYNDNTQEQDHVNYPLEQELDDHYAEFLNETGISPLDPYVTHSYKRGMFHGKHYYTVSATAAKVFQEDQYQHTLQHLIIKKIVHNLDVNSLIWGFAKVGNAQYEGYYKAGQNYFRDYLPKVDLLVPEYVDTNKVKQIIEAEIGNKILINVITNTILTTLQLCKYKLQEQYNYDIGNDILFYKNKYYFLDKINTEDTTQGLKGYLKVCFKTLKKTIESNFQNKVITIKQKDNITDIKTTTITKTTSVYRADTNILVYKTTSLPTITTTEIPHNSEIASSSYEFISQEEKFPTPEEVILDIDVTNKGNNYIFVNYTNTSNSKIYYWLYDYRTNKYPELHSDITEIVGYDIYPISTIKNNFENITGKQKEANDELFKPLNITTDTILEAVAKNPDYSKIRDVYLTFGVSPADIDPSVSTILYNLIEFYSEKTPIKTGSRYTIHNTTKGNSYPYETNISWIGLSPIEREEKICPIGECKHQIVHNTINYTAYATGKVLNNIIQVQGHLKEITSDGIIVSDKIVVSKQISINEVSHPTYKNGFTFGEIDLNALNQLYVLPENLNKKAILRNLVCGSYYVETSKTEPEEGDKSSTDGYWVTERHGKRSDDWWYEHHYYKYIKIPYLEIFNDGKTYITAEIPVYKTETTTDVEVLKQIDKFKTRTYILQNLYGLYVTYMPHGIAKIKLNAANKELVIPIPIKAIDKLTFQEQTKSLDNAVYLQIYAFDHQYSKWYASPDFIGFLQWLGGAVLITFFNPIQTLLSSSFEALVEMAITSTAITLAVKLIFKYVDSLFLKTILAVAVTVAISYAGGLYDGGFGFMDAVTLVGTSTEAINVYVNDKMQSLQNDALAFNEKYEKKEKEFTDILTSFNEGLQVEAVTDIATSTNESDTYIPMSPDYFYYQALEAYKNYDLLYDMPDIAVSERTNNLLTLKYSGE